MDAEVERLRNSWHLASCVQFLRVFQAPLQIKTRPSGDWLEQVLADPGRHPTATAGLLGRLASSDRKESDWEVALKKRVGNMWKDSFEEDPMEGTKWEDLDPTERLQLLHALCEWLCQDDPDVIDALERTIQDKDYTADALREEPIGVDSEGSRYYYLGIDGEDCRLYKETPPKTRGERKFTMDNAGFCTFCATLEELTSFKDNLKLKKQKPDRDLAKILEKEIIPKLEETRATRERAIRKAEKLEMMPRKRSGRLQILQIQKEEERRLQELEEARRREMEEEERARKQEEKRLKKLHAREERARSRSNKWQTAGHLLTGETLIQGPSREERMKQREAKLLEDDDRIMQHAMLQSTFPEESDNDADVSPDCKKIDDLVEEEPKIFYRQSQHQPDPGIGEPLTPPSLEGRGATPCLAMGRVVNNEDANKFQFKDWNAVGNQDKATQHETVFQPEEVQDLPCQQNGHFHQIKYIDKVDCTLQDGAYH